MSDTEDGSDDREASGDGSDGFDKEAEREKLRKKYEQDQKRREATEHMSELLLKGATMTNQHCDQCGSPIFRYEGETFCPTCAGTRAVAEDADSDEHAAAEGGQQADSGTGQPQDSADQPSSEPVTDSGTGQPVDGSGTGGEEGDIDLEAARERLDERAAARTPDVGSRADRADRADPPRSSDSPVRQGEVPSMAQTRASLRRAIVSLSEQAAQSDDPGRAHNLLKGAREASEALAALEGTTGE